MCLRHERTRPGLGCVAASLARVKVGIVVPYSWSFGGGVVDHAEAQARALAEVGIETRLLIGNDPPGSFSRVLHPRTGRPGPPPPGVIPLGRSVIVPGNGALSNLVLSPHALAQMRRALARERFDLIHVHEPLAPMLSPAALALWDGPAVATFHAAGNSSWRRFAEPLWGFLLGRIDLRVAVSEQARLAAAPFAPGHYEVIPNGVEIPAGIDPGGRADRIVFAGRHDPRKGLPVLLRAWPRLRGSGLRLRVLGADPLAVRLLLARLRISEEGIDVLGFVSDEALTRGARRGEAPRRAVARQRELRHDDHAGLRLRGSGRRLGHPGLSRGPDRGDGRSRPARRCRSPRRDDRGPARGRAERGSNEAAPRASVPMTEYAWPLLARRLADCYERVLAKALGGKSPARLQHRRPDEP